MFFKVPLVLKCRNFSSTSQWCWSCDCGWRLVSLRRIGRGSVCSGVWGHGLTWQVEVLDWGVTPVSGHGLGLETFQVVFSRVHGSTLGAQVVRVGQGRGYVLEDQLQGRGVTITAAATANISSSCFLLCCHEESSILSGDKGFPKYYRNRKCDFFHWKTRESQVSSGRFWPRKVGSAHLHSHIFLIQCKPWMIGTSSSPDSKKMVQSCCVNTCSIQDPNWCEHGHIPK